MARIEAEAAASMSGAYTDGVHVNAQWVIIRRQIAGLMSQINVPTSSFRGVTLRSAEHDTGYEIALLHMDTNLDVILEACSDDTNLIASWRGYGRDLGLPLLIADRDGRLQPVQESFGFSSYARRGGSPLRHRRPRFLSRRQPGHGLALLAEPTTSRCV